MNHHQLVIEFLREESAFAKRSEELVLDSTKEIFGLSATQHGQGRRLPSPLLGITATGSGDVYINRANRMATPIRVERPALTPASEENDGAAHG